jgi:serine/threonine protein kinase
MESTSIRRSRMTLTNTASNFVGEDTVSLNKIMEFLRKSDVRGPFALQACHKGAVSLGAGAQFDVYGRRMPVASGIPKFDGPYLEEPIWQTYNGDPQSFVYTARHVAIKRAYVSENRTRAPAIAFKTDLKRGVERSQLRNVTHEILALVHPLLRQHQNIVSLLGWGYDQDEVDSTLFAPILILEHARASADTLSVQLKLPLAIRKHICYGLLSGVKALHECGIVHSDVKPSNLLVFARNDSPFFCIAKISDFGFAEQEIRDRSMDISELPRGTIAWAAPEQECGDDVPVDLVYRRDIWGCGMTVWSIMALRGQVPCTAPDVITAFGADMRRSFAPDDLTANLLSPLASCLCSEVSQRADSAEEIRHALEQSDWVDSTEVKEKYVYHILESSCYFFGLH